jgi:hypothetical protein
MHPAAYSFHSQNFFQQAAYRMNGMMRKEEWKGDEYFLSLGYSRLYNQFALQAFPVSLGFVLLY